MTSCKLISQIPITIQLKEALFV